MTYLESLQLAVDNAVSMEQRGLDIGWVFTDTKEHIAFREMGFDVIIGGFGITAITKTTFSDKEATPALHATHLNHS